ncbi:hypothetical protein BCU41_015815 [Vibrio lentus]
MFKRNISLLSSTSVMSNKKDESEPKVKVRQALLLKSMELNQEATI